MMKAVVYPRACEANDLQVVSWKIPDIAPGEVLVKVSAFGLNFAEISARKGTYKDAPAFPFVPGYECSGEVVKVGDQIQRFKVGDKVVCFCDFGGKTKKNNLLKKKRLTIDL